MRVKVKRKRQVKAPKSNRKSVPSGRGSPRWIIRRKDCDKGVKKTCIRHHLYNQAVMHTSILLFLLVPQQLRMVRLQSMSKQLQGEVSRGAIMS